MGNVLGSTQPAPSSPAVVPPKKNNTPSPLPTNAPRVNTNVKPNTPKPNANASKPNAPASAPVPPAGQLGGRRRNKSGKKRKSKRNNK